MQNQTTTPARHLPNGYLAISETDDLRLDKARMALSAVSAMALSMADMAVKFHNNTGHRHTAVLEIPAEELFALLDVIGQQLVVTTHFHAPNTTLGATA